VTDRAKPRTTVVIPVWDRYVGPRFDEALASILAQDVPLTVVVVDNASTAPLPELPDEIRVLRTPGRVSLGAARNLGLSQVESEWVLFADADDVMLPGSIRRLQEGLDADPRLTAFAMAFVDAETGARHRWPRPWIGRLVKFPTLLALVNAVWAVYPITGPVLIRTRAVREIGGHAEVDNGDARCLGAALLFRGRVGWTEQPGWVYFQRPGSNLDRFSGARSILESSRLVRRRLRSDFGGPGWLPVAMPLLAAAQWGAVAAHLLVSLLRRAGAARAARARR
jgi:glycosyltransferase involved in cell wall biosynthesis